MTRPTRIRIIGKEHEISYLPTGHEELKDGADTFAGRIDNDRQRIIIEDGQTTSSEQDTLLHEVLHGIESAMDLDLEESKVRRMATGLLAVLKDNPDFLEYLQNNNAQYGTS